jgi:hypothetical protein
MKVMKRLITEGRIGAIKAKRFLERHGVLTVEEPWAPPCVPDRERWYYWCWFPAQGKFKGGYTTEVDDA